MFVNDVRFRETNRPALAIVCTIALPGGMNHEVSCSFCRSASLIYMSFFYRQQYVEEESGLNGGISRGLKLKRLLLAVCVVP